MKHTIDLSRDMIDAIMVDEIKEMLKECDDSSLFWTAEDKKEAKKRKKDLIRIHNYITPKSEHL